MKNSAETRKIAGKQQLCTCPGRSPVGDSSWAFAMLVSSCSPTTHRPAEALGNNTFLHRRSRNKQHTDICSFSTHSSQNKRYKLLKKDLLALIGIIYLLCCAMLILRCHRNPQAVRGYSKGSFVTLTLYFVSI